MRKKVRQIMASREKNFHLFTYHGNVLLGIVEVWWLLRRLCLSLISQWRTMSFGLETLRMSCWWWCLATMRLITYHGLRGSRLRCGLQLLVLGSGVAVSVHFLSMMFDSTQKLISCLMTMSELYFAESETCQVYSEEQI